MRGQLAYWGAWRTPAYVQGMQVTGFFAAYMVPFSIFLYAMQDPASVAEKHRRAERRRLWAK